ncbi:MBL fold metallo-hydrolase [Clostridium bovifaecis]|uniref:MBL fold metallo-hydrolase n=1 Tax=Clostridium bovifaecis TaxID=2184719 RepID=A0A6I6EIX9_9CLOT|nr:MBL fold metallo-hydrolase [Clostridium bovifaecis]
MKITVVGYWGAYPEKNEAATGYLLQGEGYNILVDCGSGVLSKVQNYIDLTEIDAVILSHYHGDHFGDINCFQYQVGYTRSIGKRTNTLDIYGHNLSSEFNKLTYAGGTIGKKIDENTTLKFEELKVSFKWSNHPVPCLAMRFEENGKVFAYSGDTEWSNNIIEIAKNADVFICECNLFNDQFGKAKGHLTAGEVGKIAQKSNVKKLVLTHFPHYGDLNQLVKEAQEEFEGEIIKADGGLVFEL